MAVMYKVFRHHCIQSDVDYNQFFHPSICHICKSTDPNNVISCRRCKMISYCSEEHRMLHEPQHWNICTVITWFISEDPNWETRRLSFQDWIKQQETLVQIAQVILRRRLKPYEVQMFMFAKACFTCRQRANLFTCNTCISVNYCNDHLLDIAAHRTICDNLALSLNLDIIYLEENAWKAIRVKFNNFPNENKPFNDMNSFCNKYYKKRMELVNSDFHVCTFTDYVSGPLTLYFGLQFANLLFLQNIRHFFVIHIIAADSVDRSNFPAWELFLHLLNRNNYLIIVMVGPELQLESYEHKVCYRCKKTKKRLFLQSFPLLYHNYMQSIYYRRPNVIFGFQADFNSDRYWLESIRAIQAQNCPLLLTAKSPRNVQWDMIKIQEVTAAQPIFYTKNNFSSCRPYRDFQENFVFYRNNYLVVYRDLNN